ncbi:MAG: hypothetical protein R3A13_07435 [Bdellovibrionota bacterium]
MNTRCKLLVSTLHTLVLVILCLGLSVTNSEAQFGFGGSAASPRDPNKTYDFMYYAPTNENAYFSHKAGRMVWMYGKMDATTGGKDILHLTFMFRPSSQGNLPEGLTWVLTQTGKAPNGTGVLFAYDMTNANGLGDIFGTTGSLAAYSYSSTWGASSGGFENRPFLDSTRIGGLIKTFASSVNDVTHGTKRVA